MRDTVLGKVFALLDDSEQADFLNSTGRNLRRVCSGDMDGQLCRIVDKLDGDGRDFIERLAAFIEYDRQTPQVHKRIVYEDVVEKRVVEFEEEAP
jgi:hypothetical protein